MSRSTCSWLPRERCSVGSLCYRERLYFTAAASDCSKGIASLNQVSVSPCGLCSISQTVNGNLRNGRHPALKLHFLYVETFLGSTVISQHPWGIGSRITPAQVPQLHHLYSWQGSGINLCIFSTHFQNIPHHLCYIVMQCKCCRNQLLSCITREVLVIKGLHVQYRCNFFFPKSFQSVIGQIFEQTWRRDWINKRSMANVCGQCHQR